MICPCIVIFCAHTATHLTVASHSSACISTSAISPVLSDVVTRLWREGKGIGHVTFVSHRSASTSTSTNSSDVLRDSVLRFWFGEDFFKPPGYGGMEEVCNHSFLLRLTEVLRMSYLKKIVHGVREQDNSDFLVIE